MPVFLLFVVVVKEIGGAAIGQGTEARVQQRRDGSVQLVERRIGGAVERGK